MTTMIGFSDDLYRAQERIRTREINGTDYTVRCTDPYGHWHVEDKNGKRVIKGSFTTAEKAWEAIKALEVDKAKVVKPLIPDKKGPAKKED